MNRFLNHLKNQKLYEEQNSDDQLSDSEIALVAFHDSIVCRTEFEDIDDDYIDICCCVAYHIVIVKLLCDLVVSSEFLLKTLDQHQIDTYKIVAYRNACRIVSRNEIFNCVTQM